MVELIFQEGVSKGKYTVQKVTNCKYELPQAPKGDVCKRKSIPKYHFLKSPLGDIGAVKQNNYQSVSLICKN